MKARRFTSLQQHSVLVIALFISWELPIDAEWRSQAVQAGLHGERMRLLLGHASAKPAAGARPAKGSASTTAKQGPATGGAEGTCMDLEALRAAVEEAAWRPQPGTPSWEDDPEGGVRPNTRAVILTSCDLHVRSHLHAVGRMVCMRPGWPAPALLPIGCCCQPPAAATPSHH